MHSRLHIVEPGVNAFLRWFTHIIIDGVELQAWMAY